MQPSPIAASGVRRAELITALSLAIDLGTGQPMERALRSCLLSVRLGDALGLSAQDLQDTYYTALLRFVGCTPESHLAAEVFGDELAVDWATPLANGGPAVMLGGALRHHGRGEPLLQHARKVATAITRLPRIIDASKAHCEVGQQLAARMGMSVQVQHSLGQMYERWDGKGMPRKERGDALALPIRVVQVALDTEIYYRTEGLDAALGSLAALHHERLDGSGYHRGLGGAMLPLTARILAAACQYHTKTSRRPYRPALSPAEAADGLRREAQAGRLDGEAVSAVLAAAGHRVQAARHVWPADLSEREVEVLRLLSQGLSRREVASKLVIAEKTVGHHVQHIYGKIGVNTRAGAALFAVQHGLL